MTPATEIYPLSLHDALPIFGRAAILPEEAGECVLGTSVTYYRLRPDVLAPRYCMYFMQSRSWQSQLELVMEQTTRDRKSTRLNSSHTVISYAVFCLKKKKNR